MDGYEQLPLHQAVVDDDPAEMRRLLAAGADLHAKDDLGFTAISEAISWERPELVRLLIEAGVGVDSQGAFGMPLLSEACFSSSPEVVRVLLDCGADIRATDELKQTPLHHAAGSEREEKIQLLVGAGADVNARNSMGETPLFNAGSLKMAQALLGPGADPDAVNHAGDSVLNRAALLGNKKLVACYVGLGLDASSRGSKNAPIIDAVKSGDIDTVAYLTSQGANLHERDDLSRTLMHHSANWGHLGLARWLLDQGLAISAKDNEGKSPLDYAADVSDLDDQEDHERKQKKNKLAVAEFLRGAGGVSRDGSGSAVPPILDRAKAKRREELGLPELPKPIHDPPPLPKPPVLAKEPTHVDKIYIEIEAAEPSKPESDEEHSSGVLGWAYMAGFVYLLYQNFVV